MQGLQISLEAIGSIASIASLAYAAFQTWQANKQTKLANKQIQLANKQIDQANELSSKTQAIADSLSTQFLGDYPRYLPAVAQLVAGARYSVKIMGVISSHGAYSDPDGWFALRQAIEAKIQERARAGDFEAVLLTCSPTCQTNAFKVQHRGLESDKDWSRWKKDEALAGRLQEFVERNFPSGIDLEALTLEEYIRMRIDHDKTVVSQVYRGFAVKRSEYELPAFCWIADYKKETQKAVFTLRTEDAQGHYRGAGFVTRDPNLVTTLTNMFEHYMDLPSDAVLARSAG